MKKRLALVLAIVAAFAATVAVGCSDSEDGGATPSYTVTFYYNYIDAPNAGVFYTSAVLGGIAVGKPTPDPTREGYDFNGWASDTSGFTTWNFATPIAADTQLYARWQEQGEPPAPQKTLDAIEITHAPTKTTYTAGETLDLTGLVVTAIYSDRSDEVIPVTADMLSGYDADTVGAQTVTVTYSENDITKTATFDITVEAQQVVTPILESIRVTPPTKTTYTVGDTFDTAGMTVTAVMSDESEQSVAVADCTITGYDMATAGTQTVTVTYQGKTATFSITVEAGQTPVVPTVSSIRVTPPTKTTYTVGDTFDTAGMTVTAVMSDESEQSVAVADCTITGYDMATAGTQTVTVTYQGKTATFDITVEAQQVVTPTLESIRVTPPTKTTYTVGDTFDTAGMTVTAVMSDGSEQSVAVADCTITGYYMAVAGTYTATVEYEGKTATFVVTVNEVPVEYVRITFDGNSEYTVDGLPAARSIEKNSLIVEPAAPSVKGFAFAGWYNGGTKWNFSETATADITLSAHWTAKSYTVKYMLADNEDPATETYTVNSEGVFESFALATPSKAHYTFDGWYTESDYRGAKYTELTYENITDEVGQFILYGKFIADTYSITYDFGGSADTYTVQWRDGFTAPATYTFGQRITLPTAADIEITAIDSATYSFAGWVLDDKTVGDISATDFGDKALVAHITSNPTYIVTYDHNYAGGPIVTRSIENGDKAIELQPTRVGYTFDKWYTDSACTVVYDFETETVTGSITLYAGWNINSYKVMFYPIGGTLTSAAEVSVQYNSAVAEPSDPIREGYTFVGWVTDTETNTAYDFSSKVTGDVKLYAAWALNTYTVTFDANGGTFGGATTETVDHGDKLTAPAVPVLYGYVFDGWYVGSGANEKKWSFAEDVVTGDTALKAKYSIITYKLIYAVGSGTNAANPATYKITDSDFDLLDAVAPNGYRFAMWSSAQENGDRITALDSEIIGYADAKNEIKLFAIYSDVFIATFDANGGELVDTTEPQNVKRGELITKPDEPTRGGYTFLGWKAQDVDAYWDFETDVMPAANTVLVAAWHKNPTDGTYLYGSMTDWGKGVGDVKATLDAAGQKKEYAVNGVSLKAGDEFILVTYDEDGNPTEFIKAPANFNVYGADGIITLGQSDADWEGKGNYAVKTYNAAYADVTWRIVLGVNEYGENIVSFELERINQLRDPFTGNESDSVNVVAPIEGVHYLVGNFSGGFQATDAWQIEDNSRVKFVDNRYFFGGVYLKKLDVFKVRARSGQNQLWLGGTFAGLGERIELSTQNQANVDLGIGFEDGLYNIVIEFGDICYITIYETVNIGVALAPTATVFAGDVLTKSDLSVTVFGETITEYTLVAAPATVGENTATVIYNGGVVEFTYTAAAVEATAVEIVTLPSKLVYKVGDTLDLAGIAAKITYNNGSTETLNADKLDASVTELLAAGSVTVTVTVKDTALSATFAVSVEDKLTSIKIETAPTKTAYYEDDTSFDLGGLVVRAYYNEGIEGAQIVSESVIDYTTNVGALTFVAGEKTLVVSYGGHTAEVTITVTALKITALSINTDNAETEYTLGEMLDAAGLVVTATYNSGKTKTLDISEFTFGAASYLNNGRFVIAKNSVTVTVTHTSGKIATYSVNVAPLTVIFEANGGEFDGETTASVTVYGDQIDRPADPTRENYDFAGWFNGGVAWNFGTDGVTADITLKAAWTAKAYAITFEFGDGEYTANWADGFVAPTSYTYGSGLTLPDASKVSVSTSGYNFLGWYVKGDTSAYVTAISATDSGEKTFVAHIQQAETVEFTFDFNYDGIKEIVNVVLGTTATAVAEPTRIGYTFGGWYVSTEWTALWNFTDAVTEPTAVYAKWDINRYTVTFVNDEQTSETTVEFGAKLTRPTDPEKEGHTFDGWYNGASKWDFETDTMPASALTLTAVWSVDSYKVTFVIDGTPSETTAEFGAKISEPSHFEKTGYTWDGWYNDATKWNFATDTMPAGALTLTAKWTPITYYVEYVNNGTTDKKAYTVEDFPIALNDGVPTDISKQFDGWFTAQVGGDKIENNTVAFDLMGGHTDNTLTLYALYSTKKFTVTFDSDGGSAVAAQTVEYGETVTEPADPTRAGHDFVQWNNGDVAYDFTAQVTDNLTLVAVWNRLVKVDGIYNGDDLVKAFVDQTEGEEFAAKYMKVNASESAPVTLEIYVNNAVATVATNIKTGSAAGFTSKQAGVLVATVSGVYTLYYQYKGNNTGIYIARVGSIDDYVDPNIAEGDGVYVDETFVAPFIYNDNNMNQVMAKGVEVNAADENSTIEVTFKYGGEVVTIAFLDIKETITNVGTGTDVELYSGTYDFYYNYAKNGDVTPTNHEHAAKRMWIEGVQVGRPPRPNVPEDAVAVTADKPYLVGRFGDFDISAEYGYATIDGGISGAVHQYNVSRILSVGDLVTIRYGSLYNCVLESGGASKGVEFETDTVTVGGVEYLQVKKAGTYTFYFKNENNTYYWSYVGYSASTEEPEPLAVGKYLVLGDAQPAASGKFETIEPGKDMTEQYKISIEIAGSTIVKIWNQATETAGSNVSINQLFINSIEQTASGGNYTVPAGKYTVYYKVYTNWVRIDFEKSTEIGETVVDIPADAGKSEITFNDGKVTIYLKKDGRWVTASELSSYNLYMWSESLADTAYFGKWGGAKMSPTLSVNNTEAAVEGASYIINWTGGQTGNLDGMEAGGTYLITLDNGGSVEKITPAA